MQNRKKIENIDRTLTLPFPLRRQNQKLPSKSDAAPKEITTEWTPGQLRADPVM